MATGAVLYTRVSSKDQEEGFSLAAQRELLDAYAREKGLRVVQRFEESETAKSGGTRPAFARMVEALREKAGQTVLLVEKTDRLYRNLKDWITLQCPPYDLRRGPSPTLRLLKDDSPVTPCSEACN